MKRTIEITLAGVDCKVALDIAKEAEEKYILAGMASEAYRSVAAVAFKGIKDRTALAYDDAKAKLEAAFKGEKWEVLEMAKHVKGEAAVSRKMAESMMKTLEGLGIDPAEAAIKDGWQKDGKVALVDFYHMKLIANKK